MDYAVWISILGVIVIPFVGWIFNTLITNKINDVNKKIEDVETARKSDREVFFKRLDAVKESTEKDYVRKDLYEQAMKFYNEHNDEKFKSLLTVVNTRFENVEEKIEELKDLINGKKQ